MAGRVFLETVFVIPQKAFNGLMANSHSFYPFYTRVFEKDEKIDRIRSAGIS